MSFVSVVKIMFTIPDSNFKVQDVVISVRSIVIVSLIRKLFKYSVEVM
jgi:hypothetical protein